MLGCCVLVVSIIALALESFRRIRALATSPARQLREVAPRLVARTGKILSGPAARLLLIALIVTESVLVLDWWRGHQSLITNAENLDELLAGAFCSATTALPPATQDGPLAAPEESSHHIAQSSNPPTARLTPLSTVRSTR